MADTTNSSNRFQYYVEDMSCPLCLHYKKKSERENKLLGCGGDLCRYTDLLLDALRHGRLKRERGFFKCHT